jgi:PAS domain S-box-containing protein
MSDAYQEQRWERAEATIREQAARIQAVLDAAVDAIITIDERGIVESVNPATECLFGYSANEIIGENVKVLMPQPYRDKHDTYLANYLATGQKKVLGIGREVVGRRKDGTTFPLHVAVSELRLGDRHMFTGIARDISDLKQAHLDLKNSNDALARQKREIEQVNLELRRSNDELGRFAYVASHDLQEPLRKVVAFCQALQEDYNDRLDDAAREYIKYAVEGAHRMKSLITDLLSYSRLQSQGKPMEPTDANDACDEAIQNLSASIEDSSAAVTRSPLPVLNADRAQLVRLFQNLIGNAIKYRGKEAPRVEIAAEELPGEWLFRVSDNGIGIDAQHHERIFIVFQRLHSRNEYSGNGIGLATCKRIVERAGGRIWVESVPGAGSTFCFTIPKSQHIAQKAAFTADTGRRRLAAAAT